MSVNTFLLISINYTHPSSSFVVMQIHLLPQIPAPFPCVHEFPAEFEPKIYIVRTPAPIPFPCAVTSSAAASTKGGCACYLRSASMMSVITVTGTNGTFTTSSSYGMCDCCTCYGIDEGSLSTTCNKTCKLCYWNYSWSMRAFAIISRRLEKIGLGLLFT